MSKLRLTGFAGLMVISALVGGTIIGSVAATTVSRANAPTSAGTLPPVPAAAASPKAAAVAEYCAAFRRAFAANLGVDESALAPAAKAAAIATIDAAVADGTMSKAVGDRLKARIEKAAGDGCALLAGRVGALKSSTGAALGVIRDGLSAAAKALDMTPAELGGRLRAGESLQDVAGSKNVPYATVTAAVTEAVKVDLAAAVTAGTIRQARADRVLARVERLLADGRLRGGAKAPAAPTSPSPTGGS